MLLVGCAREAPHVDRCLEGTTPTPDGCRAVPDWNPWRADASVADDAATVFDAGSVDAGTSTIAPGRDGGAAVDDGLSGTWAMRQVNTQIVDNEFLGAQDVASVNIGVVDFAADGERVVMTTRICSITAEPYGDTTTQFDAAFVAGLAPTRSVVVLEAARFEPTPRIQLVGWREDDDPTEPLPESDSDPRVFDADGDEAPGSTLHVRGAVSGEIYIAQRATTALTGRFVSADRIEGTSHTLIERVILGTTNEVLRTGDTTHRPHPEPQRSPFELIRMVDGAGCDDVLPLF